MIVEVEEASNFLYFVKFRVFCPLRGSTPGINLRCMTRRDFRGPPQSPPGPLHRCRLLCAPPPQRIYLPCPLTGWNAADPRAPRGTAAERRNTPHSPGTPRYLSSPQAGRCRRHAGHRRRLLPGRWLLLPRLLLWMTAEAEAEAEKRVATRRRGRKSPGRSAGMTAGGPQHRRRSASRCALAPASAPAGRPGRS